MSFELDSQRLLFISLMKKTCTREIRKITKDNKSLHQLNQQILYDRNYRRKSCYCEHCGDQSYKEKSLMANQVIAYQIKNDKQIKQRRKGVQWSMKTVALKQLKEIRLSKTIEFWYSEAKKKNRRNDNVSQKQGNQFLKYIYPTGCEENEQKPAWMLKESLEDPGKRKGFSLKKSLDPLSLQILKHSMKMSKKNLDSDSSINTSTRYLRKTNSMQDKLKIFIKKGNNPRKKVQEYIKLQPATSKSKNNLPVLEPLYDLMKTKLYRKVQTISQQNNSPLKLKKKTFQFNQYQPYFNQKMMDKIQTCIF